MLLVKGICSTEMPHTVADPDLEISRGGGAVSPQNVFGPSGLSLVQKSGGGARAPRAPPPDLPLEIPTLSYT